VFANEADQSDPCPAPRPNLPRPWRFDHEAQVERHVLGLEFDDVPQTCVATPASSTAQRRRLSSVRPVSSPIRSPAGRAVARAPRRRPRS
jgi:hypothetical protein